MSVGVLHVEGKPDATIDWFGAWEAQDSAWAELLNERYGPRGHRPGPSVVPGPVRALYGAASELGGTAEMLIPWEPLPDGVVS